MSEELKPYRHKHYFGVHILARPFAPGEAISSLSKDRGVEPDASGFVLCYPSEPDGLWYLPGDEFAAQYEPDPLPLLGLP